MLINGMRSLRTALGIALAVGALLMPVAPLTLAGQAHGDRSATAKSAGDERGRARFRAPSPRSKRLPPAHVQFSLPPGYRQLVGALGGNPAIGRYTRPFKRRSGGPCAVDLEASARARSAPPSRRGDRLRHLRGDRPETGTFVKVEQEGRVGSLRWFVGPAATRDPGTGKLQLVGIAVRRAPARFVAPKTAWAVFTISIRGWQDCGPGRVATVRTLGRAIRSVHLVAGRPRAVPGVPTASI
jgi:hypothetical protein